MKQTNFALSLQEILASDTWSWVIAALRQDTIIWKNLEEGFLTDLLSPEEMSQPDDWSPASLCLRTLLVPIGPEGINDQLIAKIESDVFSEAENTFREWQNHPLTEPSNLRQAGLMAIHLYKRFRENNDWGRLFKPFGENVQSLHTVMACLVGFSQDPVDFLQGLVASRHNQSRITLALHALLSNPIHPERQFLILQSVFEEANLVQCLFAVNYLNQQRPALGERLASMILNQRKGMRVKQPYVNPHMAALHSILEEAETYRLSDQPEQTMKLLDEATKVNRRLQASITAQLGRTYALIGDFDASLEAWKNALQLSPENLDFRAGMLNALISCNKLTEAEAILAAMQLEPEFLPTPAFSLAETRLRIGLGQKEFARQSALRTLELLRGNQAYNSHEKPEFCEQLSKFLIAIDLPEKAIEAAKIGLEQAPNSVELLFSMVEAELACVPPSPNLLAANLAVALKPNDLRLRRLLIECLEAVSEWQKALEERKALLSDIETAQIENPESLVEELYGIAIAAKNSAGYQEAAQVCEKILATNPEDGFAYAIMGESLLAMGHQEKALECFHIATQLTPQQAAPWIVLAQAYQRSNQINKALEVLQSASIAANQNPEIHLLLGETYLADGSITQALAAFRKAAAVISSPEFRVEGPGLFSLEAQKRILSNRIFFRLGKTLFELGHTEEARQVLGQAFYTDSSFGSPNPEIAYIYAKTLLELDRIQEALVPLRIVIEGQPVEAKPYLEYARSLFCVTENRGLADLDDHLVIKQIISTLQQYLEKTEQVDLHFDDESSRERAEAFAYLAEAYSWDGEDEKALASFRVAIDSPLTTDLTWKSRLSIGLSKSAIKLGQIEIAIAGLQEALISDPSNLKIHQLMSDAYLAAGLPEEALNAANQALKLNPDHLPLLLWFVKQTGSIADNPSAAHLPARTDGLSALLRAVEVAPTRGDILVQLATWQIKAGEKNAAILTLARLNALLDQVENGDFQTGEISSKDLAEAASCHDSLGDKQQVVLYLEKAVELSEREKQATTVTLELIQRLVEAYKATANLEMAIQALEKAIKIAPDLEKLVEQKAGLILEMGESEKAFAYLLAIASNFPSNPTIYYLLAICHRALGDLPQALNSVEKGIQLENPDLPDLRSRCLAAEICSSALNNNQARIWLTEPALLLIPDAYHPPQADLYLFWIQMTEYCLEDHQFERAAEYLHNAEAIDPSSSRVLANRSRIAAQAGKVEEARLLLSNAQQALKTETPLGVIQQMENAAELRSMGLAAQDLMDWTPAIDYLTAAAILTPHEPCSHLHLAWGNIHLAEAQRLCQMTEVIQHAPGENCLDSDHFDQAMASTLTLLHRDEIEQSTNREEINHIQVDIPIVIRRCQARGQAVFHPNSESAKNLEKVAIEPDDVSALIAVLGLIGDRPSALIAARKNPMHPMVLMELAIALCEANPRQALNAARAALEAVTVKPSIYAPFLPLFHMHVAKLVHIIGSRIEDKALALNEINNALSIWPEEPRWHVIAAEICLKNPDPDVASALEHMEVATRVEPQNTSSLLLLGKLLVTSGDLTRAIETLEHTVQIDPDLADAWMLLAQTYVSTNQLEHAARTADQAIEKTDNPVDALLLKGEIELNLKDFRAALTRANTILEIKPDNPEGLYLLARALAEAGQTNEALILIEKAIPRADEPAPMMLYRVQLLRILKGKEAALESLQELARWQPDNAAILAQLAKALQESGQREASIHAARQALQNSHYYLNNSEISDLHLLIGCQLKRSGQLDQAIVQLNEAIQLAPGRVDPYLELAQVHLDRRQYDRSFDVLKQAIHLAPNDARLYHQAGIALKENKDYLEAETYLRKATELAPDDLSIHRLLAAVVALNLIHNRRQTTLVT